MNKSGGIIRLCGPIELASTEIDCWRCHLVTPVHSLVVADVEEFMHGEEQLRVSAKTCVYELSPDAIPVAITSVLAQIAKNYKIMFSRMASEASWGNVCIHCGVLQGAFFLHSEPDGPFFGGPSEFSGVLTLVSTVGFEVEEASYSL